MGDALALAGGILAAAYVTVGADVRQSVSTTVYTTICYATAALLLPAMCLGGSQPLTGYDGGTWAARGASPSGPSCSATRWSTGCCGPPAPRWCRWPSSSRSSGSTVLAWAAFGETPPAGAYPAALLIAAGVVLVVLSGRQPAVSGAPVVE